MSFFNEVEINELIQIADEQKKNKEASTLASAIYHALGCILRLIDKDRVFNDLKKICSEHTRKQDLLVELCSFEKTNGSKKATIHKVYDWIYLLKKTDLLVRLGNILGIGHFLCEYEVKEGKVHIIAKFYLDSFEPTVRICLPHTPPRLTTEGLCTFCGSYT